MINHLIIVLLSILITAIHLTVCMQTYEDIQLVFENITDPKIYKKYIRPPIDSTDQKLKSGPLYVNVSIDLYNYATVDEITSEYTFHLFIDMEWFDPRLKYFVQEFDRSEELQIEGGQYHIDSIWYPSVFIPNNQDPGSFDYDYQSANLLKIRPNGWVWLRKRKLLRVYCDMDFHSFPFDQQICYLHLESSISSTNTLLLRWHSNTAFSKADSFRTIGFALQDYKTSVSAKTYSKNCSFSRVSLKVTLVREWAHYLFVFYLPTGIIVVASWTSFWLEITSPPARVSVGVTTLLALVTTFKNTRSQLPTVSYWNALDIWNMVCIVFIFSSLIEFATVNYIFNTEKRINKKKKLNRNRYKSVKRANEYIAQRMAPISTLETIYSSTVNAFTDRNKNISDINNKNKSPIRQELETNNNSNKKETKKALDRKNSVFDGSKHRVSVGIDLGLKEELEVRDIRLRRSSLRPRSDTTMTTITIMDVKPTPQEMANYIDKKCRRIFPITFFMFNLLYWSILQIKF